MIEIIPNASLALQEVRCSNCGTVYRATLDEFHTTVYWDRQIDGNYHKLFKKAINCPKCNAESIIETHEPMYLN